MTTRELLVPDGTVDFDLEEDAPTLARLADVAIDDLRDEIAAIKSEDTMTDYSPIVADLKALLDEAMACATEEDAEIKAGRRNSSGDQSLIDQGYDLAMQLCDLFEALGATVEEEDGEMEGEEDAMDMDMEGKGVNYDQAAQLVRDAWVQQTKPGNSENAPYPWPQAVFDDGVIISQDGCLYFVPYRREEGAITFAPRDQWRMARQTYITQDGDVKGATKGIELFTGADGEEIATLMGDGCKAVGGDDGWVSGYLVRFGGDGDLSQWRDVFDKSTDYGRHTKSDVWVHHRMLPGVGKRRLTNQAEIGMDDEGVFIKHLLDLRSSYERKLYGMVQADKLGWSSGTAPHLVERKSLDGGKHAILGWPLGLDASYTPMPAGGLGVEARAGAMKSLLADAGIDLLHAIYDNPEAQEESDDRQDAAKAADDRTRRLLLLELDLLSLEATIT